MLNRITGRRTRRTTPARISIIVPARNEELTLQRCLDSVFAQTSDRWEMIVLDDGSTDATRSIADAAAEGRNNVRVVDGPAEGVSAARNLGVELANEEFVLFLDSDDWISEQFVERMTDALDEDASLDGVRCVWAYETADGRTQPWDDLDLSDFWNATARRCPFAIHACVIRRDLVQEVGGFDTELVIGEDWDLWMMIARTGVELGFVEETMAYYFMRPRSVMHTDWARMQADLVEVHMRGTRPDPRVPNPTDDARDGIDEDLETDLEAEMLAGTMATAVPTTADLAQMIPNHPPDRTRYISADHIAGALHEAVAFGSCKLLDDWPELYVEHEARIHEMLDLISTWLERPDLVDSTLRQLEITIASSFLPNVPERIGRTAIREIDLSEPVDSITIDADVDMVVCLVSYGDVAIGYVDAAVIDGVASSDDLRRGIVQQLGPRIATRARQNPALGRAFGPMLLRRTRLRSALRAVLDTSWDRDTGSKDTGVAFARWAARDATAEFVDAPANPDLTMPTRVPGGEHDDGEYGEDYFQGIFAEPDPWLYSGPYEQTKYEQTLERIAGRSYERALEMACAEGHFTVQLAPLVENLIAADISPTALERAEERCAEFDHIEYRQVDLRDSDFPQDLDLLVCSEVLYFVESEEGLREVATGFSNALNIGGRLVMAHANLVADDPDKTGFDWEHEFGARRIGEIVGTAPGLKHISTNVAELYRIHVFERVEHGSEGDAGEEIPTDMAEDLDTHIRRMALWGGATTTRPETYGTELSYQLPILTYHRVAPEGHAELDDYRVTPELFESHLEWLRANGYYALSLDSFRWALAEHRPPSGRAVLITFDDAYQDFFDHAWPLLRDYDFTATVFAVTDKVGHTADWDTRFGEPPQLMDWEAMRFLKHKGIDFGSHTASHRELPGLKPKEIREELRRSREKIGEELGDLPTALAYPFGILDQLTITAMPVEGYDLGFTTKERFSTVWDDQYQLPRFNMGMSDDLERFEELFARKGRLNPIKRGGRVARRIRYRA